MSRVVSENAETITEKIAAPEILACCRGNEIWVARTRAHNLYSRYCHEVGHYLGETRSFVLGEVLTPDEVKDTTLDLNNDEIFKLERILLSDDYPSVDDVRLIVQVAQTFLVKFTRGTFQQSQIIDHVGLDLKEIRAAIGDDQLTTVKINDNGTIEPLNSRAARNSEISSLMTEVSGLRVLENTIRTVDPAFFIKLEEDKIFPGHGRAHKIVDRVFMGRGWRVPSLLDLDKSIGYKPGKEGMDNLAKSNK